MFSSILADYDLKIELAKCSGGKFGSVYLAQFLPTKQYVAIKKYCLEDTTSEEFKRASDEILQAKQFNHPNIHIVLCAFSSDMDIYIVSPLMCFGSCKDTIKNCFNAGFPEILVALIMQDILSALSYLHRHFYIHGSIRASHILLNQSKAVITGFRECSCLIKNGQLLTAKHQLFSHNNHSLNWLAPEVLEQNLKGYNEKSDIYSLGITCCELANGIQPFADAQATFMFTEKIRGNIPALLDWSTCPAGEERLDFNDSNSEATSPIQKIYSQRSFTDDFHQFTEICMKRQPADRWSAEQLMTHSFFKQCRNTSIYNQLKKFGIDTIDYTKLEDKSLETTKSPINGNSFNDEFTWNFT